MTTLFVSTVGGPLQQLWNLAPRLRGIDTTDRLWVTHDVAQSRSLLAGEATIYVPYIKERDVLGVSRAFPTALRLIRAHDVTAVVSTGSAIAVAYLSAASLLRRRALFVETAALVTSRTRAARIVARLPGTEVFAQWPGLATGRWRHRGSVLDGFEALEARPAGVRRVVVTVGTSEEFGFRRLIERLAAVIPPGVEVLWQTGCTDVTGLGIEATPWVPASMLQDAMAEADVVIAHAGCGSALAALDVGRRPLLVPREPEWREAGDDHQSQLAHELTEVGLAASFSADALTWSDVCDASRWRVVQRTSPPPIDVGVGTSR
jgi:UDP-N-acetylglucosamine--N-acetylmuramyl-(pentapeptide) pyrophosphoryl-undecaprenol N-acetylglucosamine transferase